MRDKVIGLSSCKLILLAKNKVNINEIYLLVSSSLSKWYNLNTFEVAGSLVKAWIYAYIAVKWVLNCDRKHHFTDSVVVVVMVTRFWHFIKKFHEFPRNQQKKFNEYVMKITCLHRTRRFLLHFVLNFKL